MAKQTKAEAEKTAQEIFPLHPFVTKLATLGDGRFFPIEKKGKEYKEGVTDLKAHQSRVKGTTVWEFTRKDSKAEEKTTEKGK